MNDLDVYRGTELLPRHARRAARSIDRQQLAGHIRASAIEVETDVALAKQDALTAATATAMSNVLRVAQTQRHLEQMVPEAAGRLAFLADDHVLSMSEIMTDLRRDLRRK